MVVDQLRAHTVDGRLSLDEFEARVEEVLSAKTHAELAAALRELPDVSERAELRSPSVPAETVVRSRHRAPSTPVPLLVVAVVLVASVVMNHFAWWLIPVGFCVFGSWGGRGGEPREERPVAHGEPDRQRLGVSA